MSLTMQYVANLSEPELYPLLKRLFIAKKYVDVRISHGSDEAGKDLVMRQRQPDGPLLSVAAVVKSKRITGHAAGKGSAAEVYFQICRAFGSTFVTSGTLETSPVDRLIVITNKDYTEGALKALQDTCRPNWENKIEFWDGARLWKEIKANLGPASMFGAIQQVVEDASQFDEHYRLAPQGPGLDGVGVLGYVEHDDIRLFVAEKYEGACKVAPFTAKVRMSLADHQRFQKALASGEPLVLSGPNISVEYPPLLQDMMSETELKELVVTPYKASAQQKLPPRLTLSMRICGKNFSEAIDGLMLDLHQQTDSFMYSNETQDVPWRIQLSCTQESASFSIDVRIPETGCTVLDYCKAIKLYDACSRATTILFQTESGPIVPVPIEPETFPSTDELTLKFAESLEQIQAQVAEPLMVSAHFERSELEEILTLGQLLAVGSVDRPSIRVVASKAKVAPLVSAIEKCETPRVLGFRTTCCWTVLGRKFGPYDLHVNAPAPLIEVRPAPGIKVPRAKTEAAYLCLRADKYPITLSLGA